MATRTIAVPGARSTRQRAAVVGQLQQSYRFRTAQELYDDLKRAGASVGLTTVYRSLQQLAEAGEVDVRRTDEGESLYRLCREPDKHHHHFHLVCRSCGSSVELADDDAEQWAHSLATKHGYTDVSHTIEIFGLCAECGTEA